MTERNRAVTGSGGTLRAANLASRAMTSPSTLERPTALPAHGTRAREGRRLDLDVVRGVAIVLALGWHFNHGRSANDLLYALQLPGQRIGWAGVDLFFVLSGFLLGRLVLKEQLATGRFDGWRFTLRRALKLWPVLYVFLAVQAVAGPEPWTTFLWQNALHVQNYAGTSLAHLWSLAVEEHFYLALAVLFPWFARRRGSPRMLAGILVAVLVTALLLRIWGETHGVSDVRLQWRTHFRVDALTAGVLLAVVSVHWPERFDRLVRHRWPWAAITALGVAYLVDVGKEGPRGSTVGFTVAYLTAAAFLLFLYRAPWLHRVPWVSAPLAALGRYSYGIYIWHVFAAHVALDALPGMEWQSTSPPAQAVKYGAAIGVGVVATVLVEKPALRLRERLVPTRSPRTLAG
jgi:peptidoglycan/LPS O-acetylase OafA/YrhL